MWVGYTIRKKEPNIWRFFFFTAVFIIVILVVTIQYINRETIIETKTEYPFQDIIDNNNYYILKNNYNISEYIKSSLAIIYNISSENITQPLNDTNVIHLYHHVQNQFYLNHGFDGPRHPLEVLERRRGDLTGLHTLFASILLTLDGEKEVYLLLTEYENINHSGIILLKDKQIHYYDFYIPKTNITYFSALDFIKIGTDYNLQNLKFRYAVGVEEVIYFKWDIDLYLWLKTITDGW